MYMKNFGEFFLDQVKTASTIIFSRTQNLTPDRVEKSRVLIQEAHPDARIITTPWDDMDPDFMLEVIENGKPIEVTVELHHHDHDHDEHDEHEEHEEHDHHHDHDHDEHEEHEHHHDHDEHEEHEHHDHEEHEHHHDHEDHDEHEHHHHDHEGHEHHHHHHAPGEHDADEVFQNIGVETARRYEQDEIRAMVNQLSDEEEYGRILRAKGILQTAAGDWFQFDYVPGELEVRPGSADYTGRLCVIGADINEKALRELFNV